VDPVLLLLQGVAVLIPDDLRNGVPISPHTGGHLLRLLTADRDAQGIDLDGRLLRSFVDMELDAVLVGLRALGLAQEDALVVGRDVAQGQRGPSVLEAEPLLVLPGFTLALALAHAEDERRLLLVHRKPVHVAEVALGMGGAALEKRCAAHFRLHQLGLGGLRLSGHTRGAATAAAGGEQEGAHEPGRPHASRPEGERLENSVCALFIP